MNRRIVRVDDGVLRIEQRLRIRACDIGTDVSGPACVYAQVEVTRGVVAYLTGDTRLSVPDDFELFLPPFAVVQASLERCEVITTAIAFRAPNILSRQPVLLPASRQGPVRSLEDIFERLSVAEHVMYVGRAPNPAPFATRAKAIIDAEYATPLEIGRIAARLRTSSSVLSRTFRETFGMPPVRYRHHVRIMDALTQFADGAAPADVFQDVGFDDLSRFYKIFRKVACAPPGSYRPAKSKTAKT
jgi:AraC-like DNA-binding protein